MHHYMVFGGCLRSAIEFPELRESRQQPARWTLRTVEVPAPMTEPQLVAEAETIAPERVLLHRCAEGYRIEFSDTGVFDIREGGSDITWCAPREPNLGYVRFDVLARVLPMTLHAEGMLCLHGSAVATADGVIAFVAPSRHGKSTLATALVRAGARLVTDDLLVVEPGSPPIARPGVQTVRLLGDSAERLAFGLAGSTQWMGDKHMLRELPEQSVMVDPAPLRMIYVLTPVRVTEGDWAVRRLPLPAVQAALSLVWQGKLSAWIAKGPEAVVLLDRATTLAGAVPVQALQVERDWARLDEVVAQLLAWHGGPISVPPSVPGGAAALTVATP
jgi:hypothetical protein